MNNSEAFSTFTMVFNCHFYLVSKHFSHSRVQTFYSLINFSIHSKVSYSLSSFSLHPSLSQPLTTTNLMFCLYELIYSESLFVAQLLSHVQLFATPWTAAFQASLSFTISQSLPKLMPIESVKPSNHLVLCSPLFLPSIFPSIKIFSDELALHIRWPKYWSFSFSFSFSFSISPSNEGRTSSLFLLGLTGLISLQSKGLSKVFSNSTVQKHQFCVCVFSLLPWSNSQVCTWLLEKPKLWLYEPLSVKSCLCFLICCLGLS